MGRLARSSLATKLMCREHLAQFRVEKNILIDRKDATLEVLSKSKTVVALSTRTAFLVIFKHGNKKLPKFVYPDDEESQQKIPVIAKLFELACLVANF